MTPRAWAVETEEAIQSILPDWDAMIGGGRVTLERARVILYRPADVRQDQQEPDRIEGLPRALAPTRRGDAGNRAIH